MHGTKSIGDRGKWLFNRLRYWLPILYRSESSTELVSRLSSVFKNRYANKQAQKHWQIALETCTACNHRCLYCPVSDDPYAQHVMGETDFYTLLDRLSTLSISRISLNHYNEPFMDRLIGHRITEIFTRKLCREVVINTNAELITREVLEAIRLYRKQLDFNINLPTVVSEERYKQLHGRGSLARVQQNIDLLLELGFRVRINMQANVYTTQDDIDSVITCYKRRIPFITLSNSVTRAGLVLTHSIYGESRLIGCQENRPNHYLNIGVNGDVFLCCQDYYKRYIFGNLLESSIEDILSSEQRNVYLDYINGVTPAPANFICRSCEFALFEKTPQVQMLDAVTIPR